MAYCEHCGQQIDNNSQFCPNCGAENANYAAAYAQPAYTPAEPAKPYGVNVMAIVGMALASLGIPGIIVSAIAKKRAASGEYSSPLAPLAKAGLIVSIICTVFWVIYIIVVAAAAANGLRY